MATEILKSFGTLQSELEQAKNSLRGVDENIKRLIGRDPSTIVSNNNNNNSNKSHSHGNSGVVNISGNNKRGMTQLHSDENQLHYHHHHHHHNQQQQQYQHRTLSRQQQQNINNDGDQPPPSKRRNNSNTTNVISGNTNASVFKRLSSSGDMSNKGYQSTSSSSTYHHYHQPQHNYYYEDDVNSVGNRQMISKVIVTPKEVPSRLEALAAQNNDEKFKARNRRMFGALLGTLQKFQQEETKLKSKEEKRAQVEKRIEEHEIREKAEIKKERQELFMNRKKKQAEIKMIELKMLRMKEYAQWEERQRPRQSFIQTKVKPQIYYLPRKLNDTNKEALESSRKDIEKLIDNRRQDIFDELQHIEDRMKKNFERKPISNNNNNKEEVEEEDEEEENDETTTAAIDKNEDDVKEGDYATDKRDVDHVQETTVDVVKSSRRQQNDDADNADVEPDNRQMTVEDVSHDVAKQNDDKQQQMKRKEGDREDVASKHNEDDIKGIRRGVAKEERGETDVARGECDSIYFNNKNNKQTRWRGADDEDTIRSAAIVGDAGGSTKITDDDERQIEGKSNDAVVVADDEGTCVKTKEDAAEKKTIKTKEKKKTTTYVKDRLDEDRLSKRRCSIRHESKMTTDDRVDVDYDGDEINEVDDDDDDDDVKDNVADERGDDRVTEKFDEERAKS